MNRKQKAQELLRLLDELNIGEAVERQHYERWKNAQSLDEREAIIRRVNVANDVLEEIKAIAQSGDLYAVAK